MFAAATMKIAILRNVTSCILVWVYQLHFWADKFDNCSLKISKYNSFIDSPLDPTGLEVAHKLAFVLNMHSMHARRNQQSYFSFPLALQPNSDLGRLNFGVSIPHTETNTRKDSSERVIGSSQKLLPTQHTTNAREKHPCPQRDSIQRPSN
jgi:hypothetical protein